MTKEQWIQQAKALLFDLTFCVDAGTCIENEINELIKLGGGYDYMTESAVSDLKWPEYSKDDLERANLEIERRKCEIRRFLNNEKSE